MKPARIKSQAGNTIVAALLITFIVVILVAIATNYTQQMSRVAKRSRASVTAMEIADGCLEMLFTNWRNIYRSETADFLPTNYFYTSIYQPVSPPATGTIPAIIPTPPPSAFPSLAPASGSSTGYTID